MRQSTHPGIILDKHYITPTGPSMARIAADLGITQEDLYYLRKGGVTVTEALACRLAVVFDTTPEMWCNLQRNYDESNKDAR